MTEVLPGGLAEQILVLNGELTLLRPRVARLEVEATDAREQLKGLEELGKQINSLKQAVKLLQGEETPPPLLWNWSEMDQQEALEAWATLRAWVDDVLAAELGLVQLPTKTAWEREIPPCWYVHRDLVWELGWLCQEWQRIYAGKGGTARHVGDWFDRYLPGVLRRVSSSSARTCGKGHARRPDGGASKNDPYAEWQDTIDADLATRPVPKKKPEKDETESETENAADSEAPAAE